MKDTKKLLPIVLVCGGLWGFMEATLGYFLHFLPVGFSGMVMFPIGFYFMFNAFKASGKNSAIFSTALIAAAIKCSDLVLPQSTAIRVLNPAVSILLEALVVFVFVEVYSQKRIYLKSFAMGLGWMLLFVMTQALIFKPAEGLYRMPLAEMLGFIVFNTVVSGLLTGTYLKKPAIFRWQLDPQKLSYVQPAIIIALAVVCELGNSLMF